MIFGCALHPRRDHRHRTFVICVTPAASGVLTHTTSVSVTVRATIAGITNVIGDFLTSGAIDNSGTANALTGKLSTAQSFISAGDNQTAVNVRHLFGDPVCQELGD